MPDPHPCELGEAIEQQIERYLDEVMAWADLSASDQRRVRGELEDHLCGLIESQALTNPQEISTMLNDQFGEPKQLGQSIARSRGRVRTYLKKKARRLPVTLAVALVLAFSVRWVVAEPFYAMSDAASPAVPKGSRCLVYKWASSYRSGDIVVCRDSAGLAMLGTVGEVRADDMVRLTRSGQSDRFIQRSDIIGKVVLNTR